MMHPRNKYCKNPAHFGILGDKYPEFRKYLLPTSSGHTINFKDPKALRELTITLLHHDFGLEVELPLDRLIPTVTLRLNYIHWIEDLLLMLPNVPRGDLGQTRGIDIGTGASCIYPLLGARINGWKFCASEVDEMSFNFACSNVKRNDMEESIQVRHVTPDIVLAELLTEEEHYDFSMCNPPFFADKSEAIGNRSRTGCRPQPSSVCTGTESETVTSGGEVEFVSRMIADSLRLKSRVRWFTTMLGKKSSLTSVMAKLKQNNISKIVTTEFRQGRTMRWGVAWTFLSDVVTESPPTKKRKKKPLQFSFSPKSVCSEESFSEVGDTEQLVPRISEIFKGILSELQITILSERSPVTTGEAKLTKLRCGAKHNTWSNQRKKRREAARRLETIKQHTANHILEDESSLMESRQSGLEPDLDEGKTRHSDQLNMSTINQTSQDENLRQRSGLGSTMKSSSEGQELSDVRSSSCAADITELPAHTVSKYHTTEEYIPENNDVLISDKEQAQTEDKTFPFHADNKRKEPPSPSTIKHSHKLLKSGDFSKNEEFFLEFFLILGARKTDAIPDDEMFLEMEWVDGHDRNCMYQLFQYFQNRLRQ